MPTTKTRRAKRGSPAETAISPIPEAPPSPPEAARTPKGKLGLIVALLTRPEGAGIDELMKATGWQAHSVRGAISGSLKKALGVTISSEKTDAGRIYRIADGKPA